MLGTLVGAGVPLVAALRVAKEAIGNQVLADTVDGAIEDVQRGTSLARSLEGCRELFPSSVIEMISVAEESGRLDKELIRLAGCLRAGIGSLPEDAGDAGRAGAAVSHGGPGGHDRHRHAPADLQPARIDSLRRLKRTRVDDFRLGNRYETVD